MMDSLRINENGNFCKFDDEKVEILRGRVSLLKMLKKILVRNFREELGEVGIWKTRTTRTSQWTY